MILFYADAGWSLNVTNLKIKFIEESTLFSASFYRNYTQPFGLPLDSETSLKLGLIDEENIDDYSVKHAGRLFIDTDFYEAFLLIETVDEQLEGSFFYGKLNIPLLETPLKELPFPTIITGGLLNYAALNKEKVWPDVSCAFPMVYDDEFHNKTNYNHFEGVINQFNGVSYVANSLNNGVPENKNVMVPFPFIMEILTVGFKSGGYELIGDFINKKENHHLILDPLSHLERFSSLTVGDHKFTSPTDEYFDNGELIQEFTHSFTFNVKGSYNIKAFINLPKTVNVQSFEIIQGGSDASTVFENKSIFKTTGVSVDENITVNKDFVNGNVIVTFVLKMFANTIDVSKYNSFTYDKSEGKLNVFRDDFSVAEFLPEITFGRFLEHIKNWLNIKITPHASYFVLDYIESKFLELDFPDETHFEINNPVRKPNQSKVYKLISKTETNIIVDKSGLLGSLSNVREEDIIEIDSGVTSLKIEERNSIFTSLRTEDADFSIMLYNGINADGYPTTAQSVNGYTFSLQEIYNLYWKRWLYFRLNSETYTDTFIAHSIDVFDITQGKFKYNKKHLIPRITKTRISDEHYKYVVETESF